MIVGKLADDSKHNVYLANINRTVNVVRDCVGNYIVSMMIAVALKEQEGTDYEEIEYCEIIQEDEEG